MLKSFNEMMVGSLLRYVQDFQWDDGGKSAKIRARFSMR